MVGRFVFSGGLAGVPGDVEKDCQQSSPDLRGDLGQLIGDVDCDGARLAGWSAGGLRCVVIRASSQGGVVVLAVGGVGCVVLWGRHRTSLSGISIGEWLWAWLRLVGGSMRRRGRLNAQQQTVLQRVGAGDDLSGSDGVAARSSARALADRGLVAVSRRGGVWRASITAAGRHYLDHGTPPRGSAARQGEREARHPQATQGSSRSGDPTEAEPARKSGVRVQRRQAAVALMGRLEASGQELIPAGQQDRDEARRVVDFAKRHGLVPEGKRVEKTRLRDGRLRIQLLAGRHPNARPSSRAASVVVPGEVSSWHPLLATLADPSKVLGVSAENTPRALRILHAVLTEAERRGHEVGWSQDPAVGVEVRIGGDAYGVTLSEEHVRRDVWPSDHELETGWVYAWQRVRPRSELAPSGLVASVSGGRHLHGLQRRWADRKRWVVEDQLGEVLATIEHLAAESQRRREAAEQQRQDRQRAWDEAMQIARARFQHDQRVEALLEQIRAWQRAVSIRDYCHAAEHAAEADTKWLACAREYADTIDPITTGAVAPPRESEPSAEQLKPYLPRRWSPHGPDSR